MSNTTIHYVLCVNHMATNSLPIEWAGNKDVVVRVERAYRGGATGRCDVHRCYYTAEYSVTASVQHLTTLPNNWPSYRRDWVAEEKAAANAAAARVRQERLDHEAQIYADGIVAVGTLAGLAGYGIYKGSKKVGSAAKRRYGARSSR